ncbi:fimbriae usher protein StfC, partial [Shigella boydii]
MAAPKTKTATNTNHPLRARFDLRDVIDQSLGNDSNLLIVFYVQIMPDD